ncbi:MAG: ABC transporter ATP-binding protein [Thermoplasmatota archaeon]
MNEAPAQTMPQGAQRPTTGPRGLLDVQHLSLSFRSFDGDVKALTDVDFWISPGEIFGLIGESGCGKSVTALAAMGLLPKPAAVIETGRILFAGKDLGRLTDDAMGTVRGNRIGMIFQEPMTALNPVLAVGEQIAESLRLHKKLSKPAARRLAIQKLADVGIPDSAAVARRYPHELSGGMRQRVMIAMMMACEPQLLIADEPTTALDVTIQAQILELMQDLRRRRGTAIWLITHDLGVVGEVCDTAGVMYAGTVVEHASKEELFRNPRHPYTIGLMEAVPSLGRRGERLPIIPGRVPNLQSPPPGCRFHPRCPLATSRCAREVPGPTTVAPGHSVRCHHVEKTKGGLLLGQTFAQAAGRVLLSVKEVS